MSTLKVTLKDGSQIGAVKLFDLLIDPFDMPTAAVGVAHECLMRASAYLGRDNGSDGDEYVRERLAEVVAMSERMQGKDELFDGACNKAAAEILKHLKALHLAVEYTGTLEQAQIVEDAFTKCGGTVNDPQQLEEAPV